MQLDPLLDVAPALAGFDPAYNWLGNSKFSGDCRLRLARCADFSHVIVRKTRNMISHSVSRSAPAFARHVGHVVSLRSRKQMLWINAERRVATVKNVEAERYGPVFILPRGAMGRNIFPVRADAAIAIAGDTANPKDASRIRFGDRKKIQPVGKRIFVMRLVMSGVLV